MTNQLFFIVQSNCDPRLPFCGVCGVCLVVISESYSVESGFRWLIGISVPWAKVLKP